MIFDNIKNAKTYFNLDEKIKKGLEFIINNDLNSFKNGKYEIDGEKITANIQEYDTKNEGLFEAHRKYIDIQYMIKGSEKQGSAQDHPFTTGGGSRRKTGFPARRHEGEDRPVPAAPLRCPARNDSRCQVAGIHGPERHSDCTTGLYARPYTQRCRRHSRRSTEHHEHAAQDVPHTNGMEHQDDHHRRPYTD